MERKAWARGIGRFEVACVRAIKCCLYINIVNSFRCSPSARWASDNVFIHFWPAPRRLCSAVESQPATLSLFWPMFTVRTIQEESMNWLPARWSSPHAPLGCQDVPAGNLPKSSPSHNSLINVWQFAICLFLLFCSGARIVRTVVRLLAGTPPRPVDTS